MSGKELYKHTETGCINTKELWLIGIEFTGIIALAKMLMTFIDHKKITSFKKAINLQKNLAYLDIDDNEGAFKLLVDAGLLYLVNKDGNQIKEGT